MAAKRAGRKKRTMRRDAPSRLELSWLLVVACAFLLSVYVWLHEDVLRALLACAFGR